MNRICPYGHTTNQLFPECRAYWSFRNIAGLIVHAWSLASSIMAGAVKPSGKTTQPHSPGESSATYFAEYRSPCCSGIWPVYFSEATIDASVMAKSSRRTGSPATQASDGSCFLRCVTSASSFAASWIACVAAAALAVWGWRAR